ncbi:MAG: hypothetical protein H7Y18_04855 [Clostridiaceae bacterium]|nr:hypothetical protein [Clostridiaceae bacterium]
MAKKISVIMVLLIMILYSTVISAEGFKHVEIFDPKQDKVVKVVQLNTEIHDLVEGWMKEIDGIHGKIDPFTDDGYVIKIPLDPAVKVQSKWLNASVREVYVIIPQQDTPFFMIIEDKAKLSCFPFNGDIDKLSKVLDFKLKS